MATTDFDPIKAKSDPINREIDPINDAVDPITDPMAKRLYEAVRENGGRTRGEYAALLGVSEATVKRRLAELKMRGLVAREGGNKAGRWVVLPSGKA